MVLTAMLHGGMMDFLRKWDDFRSGPVNFYVAFLWGCQLLMESSSFSPVVYLCSVEVSVLYYRGQLSCLSD